MKKSLSMRDPVWRRWIRQPQAKCGLWRFKTPRDRRERPGGFHPAATVPRPKNKPAWEAKNMRGPRLCPGWPPRKLSAQVPGQPPTAGITLLRKAAGTGTNVNIEEKIMAKTTPKDGLDEGAGGGGELRLSLGLAEKYCFAPMTKTPTSAVNRRRLLVIRWHEESPFAPEIRWRPPPD